MKRWKGIGLILTLSLSLMACGEATPIGTYEKGLKKFRKADAVAITVHQQLSMGDGSTLVSSVLDGELRIENPGDSDARAAMDGSMNIDLGGGPSMDVPLSYYYQDGSLYANMMGTQYRMDMSWEEACDKIGPGALPLSGLKEEDFSSLEMTEDKEQVVLDFSVNGESAEKISGVMSQWTELADTYDGSGTVSIQSVDGKWTLADGRPVRQVLIMDGTIQVGEWTVRVTNQVELSLNYENVTVELPDLSTYRNLSGE